MADSVDDLLVLPLCTEPLVIVQRDEHFLVVNKPAGLLSVPGRHPLNMDSVISRLRLEYPAAGIVHRLDFDTSGVMVIPLTKRALSHISKQFQARTVMKRYTAVVDGIIECDEGYIDLPIAPDVDNRPKYKICHAQGKSSQTEYRVMMRNTELCNTRVHLHPITGRSHQLRLHMQALGHPIWGCEFYGGKAAQHAERLLLHATELRFLHPISGKLVAIEVPPMF